MSKLVIEGSEAALEMFVDWFQGQGEQDFMECWDGGQWNGKETIYPSTYISVRGGRDGIRLVEYDRATDEEVMIEDIKGYKPHTDEKIGKVNAIKDAEVRLGLILKTIEDEIIEEYNRLAGKSSTSEEELDSVLFASDCLSKAKTRLKEASMWACRGVFRPEEKY